MSQFNPFLRLSRRLAANPRLQSWNWPLWGRILSGAACMAGIGGIVVAAVMHVPALADAVAHSGEVAPSDIRVRFINPPEWFRGEFADSLTRTAELQAAGNPLEREDLQRIRTVMMETGWFRDIAQVRRTSRSQIDIFADFVVPCTVVRDEDGDHLVDVDGVLLPMTYPLGSRRDCIALTGQRFTRPVRPGMPWEGSDIAAGLALLRLIHTRPWREQILEIDLSSYDISQSISLVTDRGCLIVWGGAPGDQPALEALTAEKLKRLDFLYSVYQRVDANLSGTIDITYEDGVFRR